MFTSQNALLGPTSSTFDHEELHWNSFKHGTTFLNFITNNNPFSVIRIVDSHSV